MIIKNKNLGQIKNLFLVSLVVSILIVSGCNIPNIPDTPDNVLTSPLPTFNSCSDLTNKLKEAGNQGRGFGLFEKTAIAETSLDTGATGAGVPSYSETNIQVKGVDEADIIKTDGRYIYTISYGEFSIVKAYPADEAEKLGSLKLDEFDAYEMFVDEDIILLFGNTVVRADPIPYERSGESTGDGEVAQKMIAPDYYYPSYSFTTIKLIDISNKEEPKVVRSVDFEGSYLTSRKIDDMVYFVINNYPRYYAYAEDNLEGLKEKEIVPLFRDMDEIEIKNDVDKDFEASVKCGTVAYFEPIQANNFVTIASISMEDINRDVEKEVIVGSGQNVYASLDNLYIAEVDYNVRPMPLVRRITNSDDEDFEESTEKTVVHKFNLDNGGIKYIGSGKVKGTILNQFSMDEYNDNFRIATTIHRWSSRGESKSTNNIYVLDEDLELIGSLEDLAPGETIYSSRFMGKKAYLVTFKKVDPFFVIDLSNPSNPKVLGKLKIPGYSDYLHPYDENHIIGIGKEAVEAKQGDFAWYQGMKIAIFDVTDVNNPVELHKVTIGDRGTDSEALYNHKAFLFDREKELLVLPINLHEIMNKPVPTEDSEDDISGGTSVIRPDWNEFPAYGESVFQGAYVYKINLNEGFKLIGRITHFDEETTKKMGYYFDDQYVVKRSLYIDDNLYTMSNRKILINDLNDLDFINEIEISKGYRYDYPYGYGEIGVDTSTIPASK